MSLNLKARLTPPAPDADQIAEHSAVSVALQPVATVLRRLRIKRAHLRAVPAAPRIEETWHGAFGLLAGDVDPPAD